MSKEWIKQFVVASLGFLGLMSVMMVTQIQKQNDLLDRSLLKVQEEKNSTENKIVLAENSLVHNTNK